MLKDGFTYKHGERLCVIRPDDSESLVEKLRQITKRFLAQEISAEENEKQVIALMGFRSGVDYTFMGYLSASGKIVDEGLTTIQEPAPGDFVVSESDLVRSFSLVAPVYSRSN